MTPPYPHGGDMCVMSQCVISEQAVKKSRRVLQKNGDDNENTTGSGCDTDLPVEGESRYTNRPLHRAVRVGVYVPGVEWTPAHTQLSHYRHIC